MMQATHDSSLVLGTNLKSFFFKTQAIWLPILCGVTLMLLSPIHSIFDEWGGVMQYFAGKEIFSGMGYHGWTAYFWPPLYSFLIGLGSVVLPGFLAGKLITILSASILLFVTYHLAVELSNRKEIGWWSQLFLVLSPIFFFQSLQAHNHMLDTLFFITGLWLFIRSIKTLNWLGFFVSGIVAGLAGLSRYTSYVLVFLPFFLFFLIPGIKKNIQLAIVFWIGFVVVSLPWWYYNFVTNGSPIYNWEYLNICTAIVPGNVYGSFSSLWWCRAQPNLNSLFSVFSNYPVEYFKNFLRNISDSIKYLVIYGGVLAPFVVPAIFDSIFHIHFKRWFILIGEILLLILLVSQSWVLDWYLLGSMVIVIIISTMFFFNYFARIVEAYPVFVKYGRVHFFLGLFSLIGLALVILQLSTYNSERNITGFAELNQVVNSLKTSDPDIQSKIIMATDPTWSYYLGAKYLSTPAVYDGSIEGLVSYQGVSDSLKAYAPKYPSNMPISELRADYLIYRKQPAVWSNTEDLPAYSFLLDPQSNKIPGNFKLVFRTPDTVVYKIIW
jgi:4-amino-4-deoxy-L-arabinose transferase-like glycosyltransferase